MGPGPKSLAALTVAISFFPLNKPSARADLLLSGYHGVRIYDEQTGAFVRRTGAGEEEEGFAFGRDGRLYGLVNDLGGGWIATYSAGSYNHEGSFGPHNLTGLPMGMTLGPDGNFYVSGASFFGMQGGIRRIDGKTGAYLGVFIPEGTHGLGLAHSLIFGSDGNLYISIWGNSKVLRFDGQSGAYIDDFVPAGSGGLDGTSGITFGPDGNLYVSSERTHQVLRYDGRTGDFLGEFVTAGLGGLNRPAGLAFGPDRQLYVCSGGNHAVLRYDGQTGALIDEFIPPGSGGLDNGPNFIAFTPRLPKVAISQSADGTIVTWPETGLRYTLETAATLDGPWEPSSAYPATSGAHLISCEEQHRFFRLRQME